MKDWSDLAQSFYGFELTEASGEDKEKVVALYVQDDLHYLIRKEQGQPGEPAEYHVLFQSIDENGVIGTDELIDNTDEIDVAKDILCDYVATHHTGDF